MISKAAIIFKQNKFLLSFFFIALWSLPIWYVFDKPLWNYDYVWHYQGYEAAYQSIIKYHQWPYFNPWMSAGQPLDGLPSIGFFSIRFLCVLFFGTQIGIHLSILIYWIIAFIGAYKLANYFWKTDFLKICFSFLIVINSAVTAHLLVGHFPQQIVLLSPWLFYFYLQRDKDKWSGLKGGAIISLAINEYFAYGIMYVLVIGLILVLYDFRKKIDKNNFKNLIFWLSSFLLTTSTLCYYRLISALYVMKGYERVVDFSYTWDVLMIFLSHFIPFIYSKPEQWLTREMEFCGTYPEVGMYLGVISIYYIYLAIKNKFNIFHFFGLWLLISAYTNEYFFSLTYWLSFVPGFSSFLCDGRIIIVAGIFLAIAIVDGISISFKNKTNNKLPILIFTVFVIEQFGVTGSMFYSARNMLEPNSNLTNIIGSKLENLIASKDQNFIFINDLPESYKSAHRGFPLYSLTSNNIGVFSKTYSPNFPMFNLKNNHGEFYQNLFKQNNKTIYPISWSPNKIVFRNLDPKEMVEISYSPSKSWKVNGKYSYLHSNSVEKKSFFYAYPNSNGDLTIEYKPFFLNDIKVVFYILIISFIFLFVYLILFKKSNFR